MSTGKNSAGPLYPIPAQLMTATRPSGEDPHPALTAAAALATEASLVTSHCTHTIFWAAAAPWAAAAFSRSLGSTCAVGR